MTEESRYHRQIILAGWGEEGQKRVSESIVLIAGAGGLGSAVSLYLAAAGVGKIILWDHDVLSLSNLNRQILYITDELGRKKSPAGAARLSLLNPDVHIEAITTSIDAESLECHGVGADLIVDCLDTMSTRYVLNRFAVARGIPLVHGGVEESSGQVTFLPAGGKPCLECIFPCLEDRRGVPVIGAAVGIIGTMEALEALKFLTGYGRPLEGRLLICEGYSSTYREVEVAADPNCPVCGEFAPPIDPEADF